MKQRTKEKYKEQERQVTKKLKDNVWNESGK